jgi:hypothetical protein
MMLNVTTMNEVYVEDTGNFIRRLIGGSTTELLLTGIVPVGPAAVLVPTTGIIDVFVAS